MENFYKELDLKYPEIAITLERFNKYSDAKVLCNIPVLLPFLNKKTYTLNTANIENRINNLSIGPCKIHTGTELLIRSDISSSCYSDDYGNVPAGQKFIIVFVGGDIDKPRVIGRY